MGRTFSMESSRRDQKSDAFNGVNELQTNQERCEVQQQGATEEASACTYKQSQPSRAAYPDCLERESPSVMSTHGGWTTAHT